MLAFVGFTDVVIVEPTPAMANDFVAFLSERTRQFRVLLEPADHAENADFDVEAPKDAHQAPTADPGPVLEDRFHHEAPRPLVGRKANICQHVLRRAVALENAPFAAGLDVEIYVDGNSGPVGPVGVRRAAAIAAKITWRTRSIGPGLSCRRRFSRRLRRAFRSRGVHFCVLPNPTLSSRSS